ncbi:MAG TPA: fibronectin type III domain-containing protein [Candidatus Angelobacter sp.]|jgi:hypothetical protein
MKRTLTLIGLSLILSAPAAFAQKSMDSSNEKAVQITSGPSITNITGTSATINWTTNSSGANRVRYRVAGSNSAWKTATHTGGGTNHSLQLTGLEPGKTYEWQILTTDGDLRTSGQFQSAATANGTAPDVNASAAPAGAPAASGSTGSGAKVPLYRASNSAGNLHLYSTNAGEQNSNGFRAEGTAGYVLSTPTSGAVPLYRLTGPSGDTLLTLDANERSSFQAKGYRDDGIVGYVASSQQAGAEPLYRLMNGNGSEHFYTTSAAERTRFLGGGWKDEGTAGYIWPQ